MRFSKNIRTTVTISQASPAIFGCTDHELAIGDAIWLETGGTLPTPLTTRTRYYVVRDNYTKDQFSVATSADEDATPLNTTVAGSGTHYFIKYYRARLSPKIYDTR